jgi:hypothetical protein
MNRYDSPQTAAIMSIGMNALRRALPSIELEVFITNLKNEDFDYTEWRQEHLWTGLSADEILYRAAANTASYNPPDGVEIL